MVEAKHLCGISKGSPKGLRADSLWPVESCRPMPEPTLVTDDHTRVAQPPGTVREFWHREWHEQRPSTMKLDQQHSGLPGAGIAVQGQQEPSAPPIRGQYDGICNLRASLGS